jgi:iron complex outermembrane receptor protein
MNRTEFRYPRFGGERRGRLSALRVGLAVTSMLVPASFLVTTPAAAQSSPEVVPESQAAASQVGDIIVTAQRRSERLVDVPMSVIAVTSESLDKAGVRSIQDISAVAAGVQFNVNGGYANPTIRGITTLTNGGAFDNNVAVYIDGFYVPDMLTVNSDFGNIQNVQVLKGPQGALYGRNATGGAILITTAAPSDVLTGKLSAGVADFNERTFSAYVSGPVAKGVNFSLSGYDRQSDGYIRLSSPTVLGETVGNAAPASQRSIRAKLEAKPLDRLTVGLGYSYNLNDDARGNLYTPIAHAPASVGVPPDYSNTITEKSYNGPMVNRGIANEGTLSLKLDTDIGELSSYTGYAERELKQLFDFDGSYRDLTRIDVSTNIRSFQQGLVYAIDAIDKLDLVVGADYYHDYRDAVSNTLVGGNLVQSNEPHVKTNAFAAYVDASYHLTDALSVTAGGRYSHETKDGFFKSTNGSGVVTFPGTDRSVTWEAFTPRVSVRYELARNTNVYASYSQGFRAGAFNFSGAPTPDLFQAINPEEATAYEVGFKMSRPRYRVEAAAFYYDYSDIHVGAAVPDPLCTVEPCSIRILTINGPAATIYGADSSFDFSPTDRLNLRASVAYVHGRYESFTNATGTGLNTSTDLNVTSQIQDWSGQQMARAPTWSGNIGADYTLPTSVGSFRFALNARFTSSFVLSNPSLYGPLAGPELANKQRYRTEGYSVLNGEIVWTDPSEAYSVTVYGSNLTDEQYLNGYSGLNFGDYGHYAPPRQLGVRVGYTF